MLAKKWDSISQSNKSITIKTIKCNRPSTQLNKTQFKKAITVSRISQGELCCLVAEPNLLIHHLDENTREQEFFLSFGKSYAKHGGGKGGGERIFLAQPF